jgi:hypothetical protein
MTISLPWINYFYRYEQPVTLWIRLNHPQFLRPCFYGPRFYGPSFHSLCHEFLMYSAVRL